MRQREALQWDTDVRLFTAATLSVRTTRFEDAKSISISSYGAGHAETLAVALLSLRQPGCLVQRRYRHAQCGRLAKSHDGVNALRDGCRLAWRIGHLHQQQAAGDS